MRKWRLEQVTNRLFRFRHFLRDLDTISVDVSIGNKLSPAQVLEFFSRDNRDSFLLPTTYEIQCYINQILQEKNKGSSDDTGQEDDGEQEDNENKLDKHIKVWLRERLYGDINAKPELLYKEIVHQFPSMATADKTSMMKQISSVKAVMKNDGWKRIT